ncbi:unnamed protein product [Amaranthus hypochondriacus]
MFSLIYFINISCHAKDSISPANYLTGDETIVSSGGQFELGFFNPSKASRWYIGIWYKRIPGHVKIWVANRDSPVSDKYSSMLKFLKDGNLVLVTNGSNSPIWSTNLEYNTNFSTKSVKAVLQDDGNFVLRNGYGSNSVIWQSFDHPTDTFMPGSKFGIDKKSNRSIVFSSWKNAEDPGTGLFRFERDPNASQLIMVWNRTQQYWSSGPYISDQHIFSKMPELRFVPKVLNVTYVDNENESYLTYSVHDPRIITRFVMDVSGQFMDITWQESTQKWVLFWTEPGQQCEVFSYCGAFAICSQSSLPYCNCLPGFEPKSAVHWGLSDYSGGCGRKNKLLCGSEKGDDKFLKTSGRVLVEHPEAVLASDVGECESVCLRNCSCTAYSYDDDGCFIWVSDLLNMRQLSDGSGKTLYVKVSASDVGTSKNKKLVIGISVGLGAGILAVTAFLFLFYWRGKRRLMKASRSMEHSLTRFSFRDLYNATKNFSQKLGSGGFGCVYKGFLPDSTVIAVKKLESVNNSQGEKQFRAEVSVIGTIQHINLVRLCGFCSEGSKRLLVYEYMPNGSLNTLLFGRDVPQILCWKVRYHIAMGIARGLAYLHEKCRDCIIHCDIKPENILLDAEYCPKVADFGLAKLVGRDFSRVLTTIRGTRGYLAPEWISGEAITAKADVYSYGMVLFELVSGRRNIQQANEERMDYFPSWALHKLTNGEDVLSIIDRRLEGNADKEEVMRICKLACWCIQDEENQRPSMGQAVQVLEGVLDVDMPSIPRSVLGFADDGESVRFFEEFSSCQYSTDTTIYASATSVRQHNSTYTKNAPQI